MEGISFSGFDFQEGRHKDAAVIWMDFKYDRAEIDLVKSLNGRWSRSEKCWYVPDWERSRVYKCPPAGLCPPAPLTRFPRFAFRWPKR
ncbi:hypothetical protein [Parapedobacter soli]|uniref:hypothetical protein n=1 Tax=Parapedobacter soli TaxID=416955 RepID=UPI0021C8336A|nr:hypothetical protein [Parapedobacter soli]